MHSAFAQQTVQVGLLPAISFTKKTNELWQYNIKLESRQWLLQQENNKASDFRFEYVLTDLSLLVSRKIRLQNTLSAGYLHRREIDRSGHRFIQQYLILKKYDRFRVAHRVVTDQTLEEREWTFRARYRITGEWALQGNVIDKQEWYLKINHEYLNAFTSGKYNLEMRIVPSC